ncbi:MAG: GIY-YIG nuclease family protein [Rhodospirillaceae bacterium]|nr:GIY-YIG nuclease family protein [Rhodospirillaceae bacterium]
MNRTFYVYVLASKRNGTLYIGVTNDLVRRVFEHKQGAVAGFTKRYGVKNLVYFEHYDSAEVAIQREKAMKLWPRQWKINKIEENNPTWRDLYDEIAAQ